MDKLTNPWFIHAVNDFEAAEILMQQSKPKVEIVCYHCQQCAEKMLKGYLATRGERLQKTHDLVVLCESCSLVDSSFQAILEVCSDLTIYASEVRYPNTLDITFYHASKALQDASFIKDFVSHKIPL